MRSLLDRCRKAAILGPEARVVPAPSSATTGSAGSISTRYGGVKTLVSLVAAAVLLTPAAARADGDPASDVLLGQDVFVTYTVRVPRARARELDALVAAAARS